MNVLPCDVLAVLFDLLSISELLLQLSPTCSQIARAVNASGSWRQSPEPHAPAAIRAWRGIRLGTPTIEHVLPGFGPGTVSLALRAASAPSADLAVGHSGRHCRALRRLDLSGCAGLTDHGLCRLAAAVAGGCLPLEELTLARARARGAASCAPPAVTDRGLGAVLRAGCAHARSLAAAAPARNCGADDDSDGCSGARRHRYRGLRALRLSGSGPGVSARTVHYVSRYAPALVELDVSRCMGVGRLDVALHVLAGACPELRVLNVYGAGGDAGLRWAKRAAADAAAAACGGGGGDGDDDDDDDDDNDACARGVASEIENEAEMRTAGSASAPEGVSLAVVLALGRGCPLLRSLRAIAAPGTATAQRVVCLAKMRGICTNLSDLMLDNVAEGART